MRPRPATIALAALVLAPAAAYADEPGVYPAGPVRRTVKHTVVREYVVGPRLVPDCRETFWSTLLECAPRAYVAPLDLTTLNELNALPSRTPRPYRYIFSW